MSRAFFKTIAGVLAAVLFVMDGALAHAAETNFWSERRRTARQATAPVPAGLAQLTRALSACPPRVEATLPSLATMRSLGVGASDESLRRWVSALSIAGVVRDVLPADRPGAPLLIHIQDVHGQPEAQKNVAALISKILELDPRAAVGVEGAAGEYDPARFRGPQAEVNHKVGALLYERDLIAGPELPPFTAQAHPAYFGLEDPALYIRNVDAVQRCWPRREGPLGQAKAMAGLLETQKKTVFTPALLELDKEVHARREGRKGLGDYVAGLARRVPAAPGPMVALFLKTAGREKALDTRAVEQERALFLADLAGKMSPQAMQTLVRDSLSFREGAVTYGDFYRGLQTAAQGAGLDWGRYPAMGRYIEYVLGADAIGPEALFKELTDLERSAWDALLKTPEQRSLHAAAEGLALAEKLARLTLTPEEWALYREGRGAIAHLPARFGLDVNSWAASLADFEEFYAAALARNDALAVRARSHMAGDGQGGHRVVVLVAGGFHTEGLTTLLKDAGTFVTVSPKMEKIDPGAAETYMAAFTRDRRPLDRLFESREISLAHSSNLMPGGGEAGINLAFLTDKTTQGFVRRWFKRLGMEVPENPGQDSFFMRVVRFAGAHSPRENVTILISRISERVKMKFLADHADAVQKYNGRLMGLRRIWWWGIGGLFLGTAGIALGLGFEGAALASGTYLGALLLPGVYGFAQFLRRDPEDTSSPASSLRTLVGDTLPFVLAILGGLGGYALSAWALPHFPHPMGWVVILSAAVLLGVQLGHLYHNVRDKEFALTSGEGKIAELLAQAYRFPFHAKNDDETEIYVQLDDFLNLMRAICAGQKFYPDPDILKLEDVVSRLEGMQNPGLGISFGKDSASLSDEIIEFSSKVKKKLARNSIMSFSTLSAYFVDNLYTVNLAWDRLPPEVKGGEPRLATFERELKLTRDGVSGTDKKDLWAIVQKTESFLDTIKKSNVDYSDSENDTGNMRDFKRALRGIATQVNILRRQYPRAGSIFKNRTYTLKWAWVETPAFWLLGEWLSPVTGGFNLFGVYFLAAHPLMALTPWGNPDWKSRVVFGLTGAKLAIGVLGLTPLAFLAVPLLVGLTLAHVYLNNPKVRVWITDLGDALRAWWRGLRAGRWWLRRENVDLAKVLKKWPANTNQSGLVASLTDLMGPIATSLTQNMDPSNKGARSLSGQLGLVRNRLDQNQTAREELKGLYRLAGLLHFTLGQLEEILTGADIPTNHPPYRDYYVTGMDETRGLFKPLKGNKNGIHLVHLEGLRDKDPAVVQKTLDGAIEMARLNARPGQRWGLGFVVQKEANETDEATRERWKNLMLQAAQEHHKAGFDALLREVPIVVVQNGATMDKGVIFKAAQDNTRVWKRGWVKDQIGFYLTTATLNGLNVKDLFDSLLWIGPDGLVAPLKDLMRRVAEEGIRRSYA
jgi:hypothetical protein